MYELRVFGNNIRSMLLDGRREEFCQKFGYSNYEVSRLEEGRLLLNSDIINKIVEYFHSTRDELFSKQLGCNPVHCIGEFDEGEEYEVLDLFDNYCDLAEAVANFSTHEGKA